MRAERLILSKAKLPDFPIDQKEIQINNFHQLVPKVLHQLSNDVFQSRKKVCPTSVLVAPSYYYAARCRISYNKTTPDWEWQLYNALSEQESLSNIFRDIYAFTASEMPSSMNVFVVEGERSRQARANYGEKNRLKFRAGSRKIDIDLYTVRMPSVD